MGLGNIPGISNGDNSPVSAAPKQTLSATSQASASVSAPITGATINFGGATRSTPIPTVALVAGGAILLMILGAALLKKKG